MSQTIIFNFNYIKIKQNLPNDISSNKDKKYDWKWTRSKRLCYISMQTNMYVKTIKTSKMLK